MSKGVYDFSLGLQPAGGTVITVLGEAAAEVKWESLVVSVAYATQAGVAQLVGELNARWNSFESANKLFVVGLDFGLTEPEAIRYLSDLPNAACYLHEARRTLSSALHPQSRFHPKLYAFGSRASIGESRLASGIVGSANLTGAALTSNFESYTRFRVSSATAPGRRWIGQLATVANIAESQPRASERLLSEYERLRAKAPAAGAEPTPGRYNPRADLGAAHLRALRAARCLWTQTLKIVENLGAGNPGNQVDLKRGSRVFFGSKVPLAAPTNTPLGSIDIIAVSGRENCNLRYGNNGMDKVNLPVPGGANPPKYDYGYVLWERKPDGSFKLHVRADGKVWVNGSEDEGTLFKYAGGRRVWGFFNRAP